MRKVQAADENLELYVLNKALIESIESLFLTKASYCTLFSQQGQKGRISPSSADLTNTYFH